MQNQQIQIKETILKAIKDNPFKNDIKKAFLFGSYLDNEQKEDSDVDILIEFKPSAIVGFFKLAQIKKNLENSIGKKVDLLTPESLSKFFKADVLNRAEIIYGQ